MHTALAGIEFLFAIATETLEVVGTTGPDRLELSAKQHVRVTAGPGTTSSWPVARTVLINGGRGMTA